METQEQHDLQKPAFLEREIRGRPCPDDIIVKWRMISATAFLLKFMMQVQGLWPSNSKAG